MSTLGLERYDDRCAHGFHKVHHPAFCGCSEVSEWVIFTDALKRAAVCGRVRQRDVRPLLRGRIEPKHVGLQYRRAHPRGPDPRGRPRAVERRGRSEHEQVGTRLPAEERRMRYAYETCAECVRYGDARRSILVPALSGRRKATGETAQQIVDRYMRGVHARHLDGLPILPERAS